MPTCLVTHLVVHGFGDTCSLLIGNQPYKLAANYNRSACTRAGLVKHVRQPLLYRHYVDQRDANRRGGCENNRHLSQVRGRV